MQSLKLLVAGYCVAALSIAAAEVPPDKPAALRVRWADAAADAGRISIVPVDADLPSGLTRRDAIASWTRAIEGTEQYWDALPAGAYRIVVRAANADEHAAWPVDVGEVLLAPGENRLISITLPAQRDSAFRELSVAVSEDSGETVPVARHWRNGKVSPLTVEQTSPRTFTVRAHCADGDVLQVQTRRHLGIAVLNGDCKSAIAIDMVERTDIAARVTVPSGIEAPSWGTVRGQNCSDGRNVEIPFSIVRSRIETAVPAQCAQLRFAMSGFTPVTVNFRNDLGSISLSQSAAVAMRIRGPGGELMPGVRVTSIRSHDLAVARERRDLERYAIASAVTNAAGWVRLAGLPPERIAFVLHAPGRSQPQISGAFTLERGTELVLDDLVVERGGTVLATVALNAELAETVEVREVQLMPKGRTDWPERLEIRAELTPSGAVFDDVPAGTWTVRATGRVRKGFAIQSAATTIEVLPGGYVHVPLSIHDTLYHGRVLRGGEPVAGVINLFPKQREGRRQPVTTAGADGRFTVLLEKEGDYAFSLQEYNRDGVRLDHYVHFGDPDEEVTVELPEHRVRGRVVDAAGAPIAAAAVTAKRDDNDAGAFAGTRSAPDGTFEIVGVSSGVWSLVSQTPAARSEAFTIAVNGGDVEGVTLLLDPTRTVRIQLLDVAGTPVRDAIMSVQFPSPDGKSPKSAVTETNNRGIAEFRVTDNQQMAPNTVVVATRDLRLSCALVRLDTDQTIRLASSYAEVRVRTARRPTAQPWLVSSTGCSMPFLSTIGFERDRDGGFSFKFAQLASGTWTYVEVRDSVERAAVVTGRGGTLRGLVTFSVTSDNAVRVELPER